MSSATVSAMVFSFTHCAGQPGLGSKAGVCVVLRGIPGLWILERRGELRVGGLIPITPSAHIAPMRRASHQWLFFLKPTANVIEHVNVLLPATLESIRDHG